jgi:DNA-binding GntR family transcriptional regulator
MQHTAQAGEPLTYSELNSELHRYIQLMSGQDTATRLLERLNAQLVRHRFRLALQPGRPQVSLGQHLAIIAAIRDHDPQRAEQAVREHLSSVISTLCAIDGQVTKGEQRGLSGTDETVA